VNRFLDMWTFQQRPLFAAMLLLNQDLAPGNESKILIEKQV